MFCEQCGNQMTEDSLFCPNCGKKNDVKTVEDLSQSDTGFYQEEEQIETIQNKQPEIRQQSVPRQSPAPQQRPAPPRPQVNGNQAYVDLNEPMSVGSYIITFLLLSIPIVGFILLLVWALGSNVNKNKKNLAIAILIFAAISIVVGIVFGAGIALFIGNLFNSGSYY